MLKKDIFTNRKIKLIGEENYRKYAVLVPFIETPSGLHLLFELRSNSLKRNPGEICFPGGRLEDNESLEECAVRETVEELLVKPNQIEVFGQGDIYISPFNLMIYPFVGRISEYKDTFSKDEVATIIKIPFEYFMNHEPSQYTSKLVNQPTEDFPYEWIPGGKDYPWAKGSYEILFYSYENWIIWGMTAQIINSITKLMKDIAIDHV